MYWVIIIFRFLISLFAGAFNLLMSIFNAIRQSTNEMSRQHNNRKKQGIVHYKPTSIDAFVNQNERVKNIVVSGGTHQTRLKTMISIVENAQNNNYPVILLHENDIQLSSELNSRFGSNVINVTSSNPCFEPFMGLTDVEIGKIMIESASKDYDIKHNAKYYLEGMGIMRRLSKKNPTLRAFASCPHMDLFDNLDAMETSGRITYDQSQKIKSKLMAGQTETFKIESFIQDLMSQCDNIVFSGKNNNTPHTISDVIKSSSTIAIDITSGTNLLLLNVITNLIKHSIGKGSNLLLVIDDVSFVNNEQFTNLLKTNSEKCKTVISSSDLYASSGGDEKLFHTLIGNSEKTIIMSHSSGASATKWADAIGYYDMTEAQQSISSGKMRQNPFQLFPGSQSNQQVTYQIKREHIVKPELINRMQPNEAYIYDHESNELAHTKII